MRRPMTSTVPQVSPLPLITNDQGQSVNEHDLLAAMKTDKGYEAFELARQVSLSTTQVRTLLEPLIAAGKIIVRHSDRNSFSHHRAYNRTRYYRNTPLPGSSTPTSTALPALLARNEAERQLLAAMSPGIGYSAAALSHELHVSIQRATSLMPTLIEDGKIVALPQTSGETNDRPRYLYYLAGTEPQRPAPVKTEPGAAPPPGSVFTRLSYDAEYGRSLTQHRDLCNASRGRNT